MAPEVLRSAAVGLVATVCLGLSIAVGSRRRGRLSGGRFGGNRLIGRRRGFGAGSGAARRHDEQHGQECDDESEAAGVHENLQVG